MLINDKQVKITYIDGSVKIVHIKDMYLNIGNINRFGRDTPLKLNETASKESKDMLKGPLPQQGSFIVSFNIKVANSEEKVVKNAIDFRNKINKRMAAYNSLYRLAYVELDLLCGILNKKTKSIFFNNETNKMKLK